MVERQKLPNRRFSETMRLEVHVDQSTLHLIVTVGFDTEQRRAREVFCASFKEGTGINLMVMDTCVMMSLLLQHGYRARDLQNTLADGPSLFGAILKAVADLEENKTSEIELVVDNEATEEQT